MTNIIYILSLIVYSVIIIVFTLKSPIWVNKIKQLIKQRNLRKHEEIKKIVRDYLEELAE